MKILYFAPHQLWPVNTGARLRNLHLSRYLAQHAAVTLLQIRGAEEPETEPPAGSSYVRVATAVKDRSYTPAKIAAGLWGPVPLTIRNYYSPRIEAVLRQLLAGETFDVVQLESVHLGQYIPAIRKVGGTPRIIADWHNIESTLMRRYSDVASLPKRLVALRTAALLRRSEAEMAAACDAITVVSEHERRILTGLFPGKRVVTIPNGVDAASFEGEPDAVRDAVLFTGSMDYHANIDAVTWFVREVWPAFRRRFPGLRFVIAGRDPAPAVRALSGNGVEVTGTIPDIRPYYAMARALVVPLRVGGGTRLKILEAMAAGVPVISTPVGAEGIEALDGRELLLAATGADILAAFERLARIPGHWEHLAAAGKELARTRYDWSIVGQSLLQLHQELAAVETTTRI